MKVISISTDRNIFNASSPVSQRMKDYGSVFGELHIIIFSLKKHGYKKMQVASNVWAYPTNSRWKIFYPLRALFVAIRICGRTPAKDIVVSTQDPFDTGVVGVLIKFIKKARLNVQVHTDMYSQFFAKESFLNKIRVFVASGVFKRADSVRVVSKKIRESLVDRAVAKEKISILPIYVDKENYDGFQDVARKDRVLLAVSRLTPEKNLFFLIDVIDDVVKEKPDTQLLIVGDGPLKEDLLSYVREKKLDQHIKFVGWKQNVGKYYRQAGLFVHTSKYEGYGMVFVEAALQHVPIVSSDVGIMGDVLIQGKSAQICQLGDKESFVRCIIEILEDSQKAQQMSDAAYKSVIKHISGSKEQYLTEYKEIVCGY